MSNQRRTFRLGDILKQVSVPIEMEDYKIYNLASIKRRNGGFFDREKKKGKDILTKTLSKLIPGAFVISKMQVVHGACAMAPNDADDKYISSSYVSFLPKDPSIIDIAYLEAYSHTRDSYDSFFRSSQGVHIEKMTFKVNDWLKEVIELPPISEQKKIVEILSGVDRTLKLIDLKINKLSQKTKSISQRIFLNNENSLCEFKELGELADFNSGRAFKSSELSNDGIKITRISNLHKPNFPYWRFKGEYSHKIIAKDGDILFSWAGVANSINIHRYKGEDTLLNQHIYNFKFHNELMKEWTFYYVRYFLPTLRSQIEGGAGQLHLTKGDVQGIKIPILSTHFMENCILLLKNIDKTIFNYQMKRSKISLLKNGLSRDLLSGLKNLKI